jgi:hypothetical protein
VSYKIPGERPVKGRLKGATLDFKMIMYNTVKEFRKKKRRKFINS